MRALVTGGAGYIGSFVVRALRDADYGVVVLDRLSTGHRAALGDASEETPGALEAPEPGSATLVVGDAGDDDVVSRVLDRGAVDAVIHCAGDKSAEASVREPARYFQNNAFSTLVVGNACAERRIPIVFSSSCAVYGTPSSLPVGEDAATEPENPYGESKLIAERMLGWLGRGLGLRHVSLRYFNAAGAALDGSHGEDWTEAPNLIPVVLRSVHDARPVTVHGTDYATPDGTAVRDYVHVLDLADAHIRALEYVAAGRPSVTINLGTGRGHSVREVLAEAERATGATIEVITGPRRVGDPPASWADPALARSILGWQARYGLSDVVASAWRWHSTHPVPFAASDAVTPAVPGR